MRKVSLMMLSYNKSQYTKLAINCLMGGTDGLRYPVEKFVLVDNGSTDDTVPWFKQQFLDSSVKSSWIKSFELIENKVNLGIAVGQNQGAQACDPDSDVVMISNDIFLGPNWLSPMVKQVERHKALGVKLGWVAPFLSPEHTFDTIVNQDFRQQYFDQWYRSLINCQDPESLRFSIDQLYGGSFEEFSREFVVRNQGKVWDEAPSMCFYWTREAINEVGYFDEQFSAFKGHGGWGSEDVDLYVRMNNAGFFRVTTFESFAHHLVCGTTRKITLDDPYMRFGDIETGGLFLRKWISDPRDTIPVTYPLDILPGSSKRGYQKWLLRKNQNFGDVNVLDLGLTPDQRKKIDEEELKLQGIV